MTERSLCIVGLMSGTSVDGIDAVVADIHRAESGIVVKQLSFCSIPWEPPIRQAILRACTPDAPIREIVALDAIAGNAFADAALAAIHAASLSPLDIAAIASHGQTVWHQPAALEIGGRYGRGTFQLGCAATVAGRTGLPVISRFRSADMAAGGQGAPLVPYVDYLLFSDSTENRVVHNFGGIANLTALQAGAGPEAVIAFDTGPGNMVMDELVSISTDGRLRFDEGGRLARAGRVDHQVLSDLLLTPFLNAEPPKSTGREQFGYEFALSFRAAMERRGRSTADMLSTALALTVESCGRAYERWIYPRFRPDRIVIGGGGASNSFLLERLSERLSPAVVCTHEQFGIANDAKEALAFAVLGFETLNGRTSNLPAATGASCAVIQGDISLPPGWPGHISLDTPAMDCYNR